MIISKRFKFEAAHQLPWHNGQCKRLHGHSYKLEVFVRGELNQNEVIMDFGDLTKIVNERIIEKYDHQFLNDFFPNPTAEAMAQSFLNDLKSFDSRVFKIELQETESSKVIAEVA